MSDASLTAFVSEILTYAKGHLPIREVSYETVGQMVRRMAWGQWQAAAELQKLLLKEVCNKKLEELSSEQVGLFVALKEFYRENGEELPAASSSSGVKEEESESKESSSGGALVVSSSVRKMLHPKYLPSLHTAMFAGMQHYAVAEKLHSTWRALVTHLWRAYPFARFEAFWQRNVDEALFGGSGLQGADSSNATAVRSTSYQKKLVGFQVVQMVLQLLPSQFGLGGKAATKVLAADALAATPEGVSQVLALVFQSRHFLRTLINHLGSKKNLLYGPAVGVKNALHGFAKAHPENNLAIVTALEDASAGGHARFDTRTHSDTVARLVDGLDVAGVNSYVDKLIGIFVRAVPVVPSEEDAVALRAAAAAAAATPAKGKKGAKKGEAAPVAAPSTTAAGTAAASVDAAELAQAGLDATRNFVADQLFALARNHALPREAEQEGSWLHRVVQFFLYFGFFDSSAKPSVGKGVSFPFTEALASPLSTKVQASVGEKLFHLLNELLPHAPVSKRAAAAEKSKAEKKSSKKDDKLKGKKAKKGVMADSDEESDEEMEDAADDSEVDSKSQAAFHALFAGPAASASTLPWAQRVHADWTAWTSSGKKGSSAIVSLASPLSKEESAARTGALEFLDVLRGRYASTLAEVAEGSAPTDAQKSELAQMRSLQLLLLHLALLLLKQDEREFAAPLLEEVQQAVSSHLESVAAAAGASKKKGTKKAAATSDPEAPVFINVLVDILLSLLIRPSNLFRELGKAVFGAFAPLVNEEALLELTEVLRRKDKQLAAGGAEDDEDEDEANFRDQEGSSEEDEEEDEEEETDAKGKKLHKAAQPKKGSKQAALDAQAAANAAKYAHLAANSDDEDDEDMIDLDQLDKVFAAKSASGKEGLQSDSEDDNNLDMAAAYDAHLSNIVRLRNEKRTEHKELQQQSLHFKLRVADLLEVWLRSQARNPLSLQLFIPLLLAIDASRTSTESKQLEARLVSLFKKLASGREHPEVTPALAEQIRALQTTLMARAVKTAHRESLHLTNLALIGLTKITVPRDVKEQVAATEAALAPAPAASKKSKAAPAAPADSSVAFVLRLYRAELVKYLSVRHSLLNTRFFETFVSSFPGMAWSFAPMLAEMAQATLPDEEKEADKPRAASAFLRNDCFLLLGSILAQRHILKDAGAASSAAFAGVLPALQQAVRSNLLFACLPAEQRAAAKQEDSDSSDEDDEEEEKPQAKSKKDKDEKMSDANGATEDEQTKKLREKERWEAKEQARKLKARAKKKRRLQRQKEAAKLAASGAAQSPEALEREAIKSSVMRLKTVLKCANQAALVFQGASAKAVSPVASAPVQKALSALPVPLATPLKAALHNFLQSARVDRSSLKLNIDDAVLAKQRAEVKAQAAQASQAKAKSKAPKGQATAAAASDKKAANGKKAAAGAKPAKVAGQKRSAGAAAPSGEKKQKREATASPAGSKSPKASTTVKKGKQ